MSLKASGGNPVLSSNLPFCHALPRVITSAFTRTITRVLVLLVTWGQHDMVSCEHMQPCASELRGSHLPCLSKADLPWVPAFPKDFAYLVGASPHNHRMRSLDHPSWFTHGETKAETGAPACCFSRENKEIWGVPWPGSWSTLAPIGPLYVIGL